MLLIYVTEKRLLRRVDMAADVISVMYLGLVEGDHKLELSLELTKSEWQSGRYLGLGSDTFECEVET